MRMIIKTFSRPFHIRCTVCDDLNRETADIYTDTLRIEGGYFSYTIPIIRCPVCGTILKKYANLNKNDLPKYERER